MNARASGGGRRAPDRAGKTPLRRRPVAAFAVTLALAVAVQAQPFIPHLGYVYPAGGRTGSVVTVIVGGQRLDGATNAVVAVSGAGVEAVVTDYTRPLNPREVNRLREQLRALQQKRAAAFPASDLAAAPLRPWATNRVWTAQDQRTFADLRRQFLLRGPRRSVNPAIAETATLRVTIKPEAEPGERELRLRTPTGLSNPLWFWVGQLPEFTKTEKPLAAGPGALRLFNNPNEPRPVAATETDIAIPAVVNGQSWPGGVDSYRFTARAGQRLVVAVQARSLMPYLADAVPGWFQPAISLWDNQGHEVAFADHYRFHPDPVLAYTVPTDGAYQVRIRDTIYRGRADFVYRLTVGAVPFLTDIFPLGGRAGKPTSVKVFGWNLPTGPMLLDAQGNDPTVSPVRLAANGHTSTPVLFATDPLPEVFEREPNDSPAAAQPITLPVVVNGRIEAPGDWDVFRFDGRAGQTVVAEVQARRLGSPLDSVLRLTDAHGGQLAFNDDYPDPGLGLETHAADSYLRLRLPADGTYYVWLGDVQQAGGPEYAYRLRLSQPRPDFALRVVPSSLTLRGGLAAPLTVHVLRRDGFTNAVAVRLVNAPPGFALSGGEVPAGAEQARVTLTAPPRPSAGTITLRLEGRASIAGEEIVRSAVPAEEMEQAFAYYHLVPQQELRVAVVGRGLARNALRLLSPTPLRLAVGGTERLRVATPGWGFVNRFQFELEATPDGITIQQVAASPDGAEIELRCDAAKTKAGARGNLIVRVVATPASAAAAKGSRPAAPRRFALGTLPAIPYEVVER